MKTFYSRLIALSVFFMVGLVACAERGEEKVPVSEVPSAVLEAIETSLPGLEIKEAERSIQDNEMIYELEGKLPTGEEYEIEVTESGKVIEVELED